MSKVKIPYGENPAETARALLDAADAVDGYDQGVVETTSDGVFVVPEEVAKKSGLDYDAEGAGDTVADEAEADAKAQKKAAKKAKKQAAASEEPGDDAGPAPIPDEVEALKGASLDQALKDRGLPVKGKVAEKKQAIADHDAQAGA